MSDEYSVAVESATVMAEIMGQDVGIHHDLRPVLLSESDGPYLEIIRCPQALKKAADTD